MTHFPRDQDDQHLIAFLKQNRPMPPLIKEDCEAQLMAEINHLPQIKPQDHRFLLFLSGAIASLLLIGGGMGWLSFKSQMARMETNQQLEAFLIDGWYGAMGETSYTNAQSDFEVELSLMSDQLTVNNN